MIKLKLKIDHVHIKVSDLENTIQFYRSILGFKLVRQESKTVFLSSSDTNSSLFLIALTELKDVIKPQRKQRVAGLYHFAILLPERRHLAYFLKTYTKES